MKSIFKSILPSTIDLPISMDGLICGLSSDDKYKSITKDNTVVEYPAETVFEVPGFLIPTEASKVKVGDFLYENDILSKVIAIKGNDFEILNIDGEKLTHTPSVNKVFNKKYVTVISTFFNNSSELNSMLFMLMNKDKDRENLLPFLFMQNSGESFKMDNPLMLAALMSGDVDSSTMLMMQMMNNQSK